MESRTSIITAVQLWCRMNYTLFRRGKWSGLITWRENGLGLEMVRHACVTNCIKGSFRRAQNLWVTAHLPLPWLNINTYFSLGAKLWLRGGVGGQLPRNLDWTLLGSNKHETNVKAVFKALLWVLLSQKNKLRSVWLSKSIKICNVNSLEPAQSVCLSVMPFL